MVDHTLRSGSAVAGGTHDVEEIEAPVTFKAYVSCAFACFGGILYGYDSGYISGVLAMNWITHNLGVQGSDGSYALKTSDKSLIVSILSAGTFFGALFAGNVAEWIGRRPTIMASCLLFAVGVAVQVATSTVGELVAGRLIAGFGVGGVSATVILYVSEISPKKIRGALVSCYQWAITIGLLLASCVDYGTQHMAGKKSFRIPIALQFVWAGILGLGLFFLPESPRYFVKKGKMEAAAKALASVRGQPIESRGIQAELAEIQANYEYEVQVSAASWLDCFRGGLKGSGNLRRVLIGIFMQMFQQWTGVNFIFYYGTTFFAQVGISNSFLISTITNVVNVASTPFSFWAIERLGRRTLLIYGALVMLVCEFIVAAVGTALPSSDVANKCLIAFTCIYIAAFASTWGPAAWVVVGELFPLPIRAKGVALSTASNWFWNCVSQAKFG